ncbi:hypothetical protein LXL04_033501 [Taraxacum kok-saghyz]
MTESKRRRVFSCAEEDRISNLQEHLLDSILERVPIEDAARTSILSRKWRHTWRNMRALVFDKHFSNKFAKNGAFRRNIPPDSFQEVDQWMYFLSRNGVTEIILTNSNQLYKLPCYMFCCRELRKLKLKHCLFKPPLEFKAFLNLEDLELTNIDFGDNLCGSQISLPQLKTLSLSSVRKLRGSYITIFGIHDFVGGDRKDLSKELSHLPEIKDVHIDSIFRKCLFAENIPKWLPHPVISLKRLRLQFFQVGDLDQLHGALCLLRNSPNVEQLYLKLEPRVDEGPALNHLKSSNCLDCTLNQLQTVEITDLQGSRPEMLFIELLLAHSPSLHKFTIKPSRVSNVKNRLFITIDVMRFSRASPKAKLLFVNS